MTNKLYTQWADELIQHIFGKLNDPFNEHTYNDTITLLAEKLESDVKGWLIPEKICNDCDYQRRYGQ